MINPLYLPELREMLAEQDTAGLGEFCTALHPGRTAEFMEGLDAAETWAVLQHTDAEKRVEIFGFLEPEKQVQVIETAERGQIAELIDEMPADDRVDLLELVDPAVVSELMALVPQEDRRDIIRLRSYPEQTAGAVMTTEVAKVPETISVGEAMAELTRQASALETIYYVYIVDDQQHLRGVVSCRDLVSKLGESQTPVGDIMERDLVSVDVADDQEMIAEKVARYDLAVIPVVDHEYRLLGIITHDDVIDVVREEATEDAHRLSAVEPLKTGYLETPWVTLAWNRGLWLFVLFIGALLTAFALQRYESDLEAISWLVLFLPLVISSGGNSGSQSATLIITALTVGDVRLVDWWRIVRRELLMGLSLGSFLAVIGYLAAMLLHGHPVEALVIPITILLVVMGGMLLGAVLPLIFSRLGWDPALMSNPLVAMIVDIVGILVYMQVALAVLAGG